ncbi:pentapeptide repeat-containing protein [Campylobacter coli]|uniref:pentapeptide repeat-containing protein n=1 Tax=Campylobacter coli TaxID=195 RepID=UPI001F481B4E|nr:pentapeptide repeat-containing protein [Campylobacter coli]
MKSEILTLSQDKIENIKEELCSVLGYGYKDKIEVKNKTNIDESEVFFDKKKHKYLFIISNKEEKLLDLEINLKELSSLTDMDYQIKFEGYRIKFIDSFSEEKIKIGQNLYFDHCDFKAIKLKNICFENFEINGYRYKSDQKQSIVFRACEFKELSLNNSIFSEDIKFEKETKIKYLHVNLSKFKKYFFIQNCTIKNISLWKNKFKNRCYFVDSNFGYKDKVNKAELNFSNAHFEDEVYFNNSEFYNYADFHECTFDNIACFYGVKFYKAPNFSACYFKESKAANLINVDIDKLEFKSVEKYIEDNYQDESYENKIKGMQNEKEIFKIQNKHKLRYAKNLKDSFRVIKDILITQNNILEAQEWHKLELYAKEKELEIQLDNKNNNSKKEYKNQIYNPKDYEKVDSSRIIPIFMHLLKVAGRLFLNILIFIELILVVPFFAVMFYCVYIGLFMYKILVFILKSFYPLSINKFKIFWKIKLNRIARKLAVSGRKMLDYTLWFDCVLLQVYRNTSNHHTNFLKILNFTILMISSYAIFGLLFLNNVDFILFFDPMAITVMNYVVLLMLLIVFIDIKRQLYQYGAILLFLIYGIFIISIVLFLSPIYIPTFYFLIYFASILISYLLFTCKIKLFVFILRLSAYICLIVVIILKPQLINPFAGIFSSDKLYESQFEKSLNDLNASAIINLASISQNDFNLHLKDQNISFAELNSAKALIVANKEKLKEVLSKVYNDKHVSDYKKVLSELENNTSNVKNIIEEIDNKNNNSVVSAQLNKFLKLNFSQEIDSLYMIKRNFSISEKLSPEQMALFDQKDSQDKLKNVLSLLKFKSRFEGVLKVINRDEIIQNTIKSTSVLYGIILLLCIFSLQKTARKNSIVPS